MTKKVDSLHEIIERVLKTEDECLSLNNILQDFGYRSYAPLLLIVSFILITPLGAIPLFPSTVALFIIILSLQIILKPDEVWYPKFLREREIERKKLENFYQNHKSKIKLFDNLFKNRLGFSLKNTERYIAVIAIICAALIFPLELIPLAVFIPAIALVILSMSLLSNDTLGLIISLGILSLGAFLTFA